MEAGKAYVYTKIMDLSLEEAEACETAMHNELMGKAIEAFGLEQILKMIDNSPYNKETIWLSILAINKLLGKIIAT